MDPNLEIARQRLSVLELAEALGNVSEACRQRGMTRTQFYKYKRRFETHSLEGLKDRPPIPKSHPMTTPPEVVERVKALALEHPFYGCNRLEALFLAERIRVSYVTIQKILNVDQLGSRSQRRLVLEKRHAETAEELSAE